MGLRQDGLLNGAFAHPSICAGALSVSGESFCSNSAFAVLAHTSETLGACVDDQAIH